VTEGARLFFQETFAGNSRTCGTCHPATNGFTLSPEFIATLPADDPLFVAERNPALADLENPALMRSRALILENVDGFDQPPVFRGVPHVFSAAFTPPFGWSASLGSLREFAVAAVRQHFPRTLARIPGVDFRLPTEDELDALEAFMTSLPLPADTEVDLDAFLTTPAERRGRDLFFSIGCASHHAGAFLGGFGSFDTGVVNLAVNRVPPPECDPPCDPIGPRETRLFRAFDVPMLFGLASTAPFFHDNSAPTLRDAVAFYAGREFAAAQPGFQVSFGPQEIDDITAFLAALTTCGNGVTDHGEACDDGNAAAGDGCRPTTCTVERCGDGIVDPGETCDDANTTGGDECDARCAREG
jgi:cysteine-rich repeat protein